MAISANKIVGVRATVAYDDCSLERSILSNDCQATQDIAEGIVTACLGYRFDPLSGSAAKIDLIRKCEQENLTGGAAGA